MFTIKIGIPTIISEENENLEEAVVCVEIKDDSCDVFYPKDISRNSIDLSSSYIEYISENEILTKIFKNAFSDIGQPLFNSSITKIRTINKMFIDSFSEDEMVQIASDVSSFNDDKIRFSELSFESASVVILNWLYDWTKSYLDNHDVDTLLLQIR